MRRQIEQIKKAIQPAVTKSKLHVTKGKLHVTKGKLHVTKGKIHVTKGKLNFIWQEWQVHIPAIYKEE